MKAYRVVVGYLQLRFTESGEPVKGGEQFPITPFNIIVDSPEVAEYLVSRMDIKRYKLIPITKAPTYLEYELN